MSYDIQNFKVTVAVHAKYQAFRLAEGLATHGVLHKLFTVYPKFKIPPYKIPRNKVRSFVTLGGLRLFETRLHMEMPETLVSSLYDYWVATQLRKPAQNWVFHGWAAFSENSLRRAKELGGIAVVDRACPHIDFQTRIVAEERSKFLGIPLDLKGSPLTEKMRREYDIADFVVVPSSYSRNSFLERGFDPRKIISVPICNEKLTFPSAEPKSLKNFIVLCVGGLFYRKGIFYLVEAWKKLNLPDAELIIKGDVPKELKALKTTPNIRFITSHISDEEIGRLYQQAHLFVLPSVDDGFGMVVVEAMTAGVPVIVTENVGVSEGIENGKTGFVIPIRSSDAIAEKIQYFYDHPEKISEMGNAAKEKAKDYSPDAYVCRAIEMYKRILR